MLALRQTLSLPLSLGSRTGFYDVDKIECVLGIETVKAPDARGACDGPRSHIFQLIRKGTRLSLARRVPTTAGSTQSASRKLLDDRRSSLFCDERVDWHEI